MKNKSLILSAILMAVSSTMTAQENIQKAFDALKQSKGQQETYTNHFLEKDPDTGVMEGMSDEYEFKIADATNKHLITTIRQAFTKDEQAAYSVSTGSHGGAENYTSLAVGNGNKGGISIGLLKDSKWIYACFLDPEDSLKTHRYAYALEWVEMKDGSITGRLVKTYATTQKFRQRKTVSSFVINGKTDLSSAFEAISDALSGNESEKWLNKFNNLRTLFQKKSEGPAANSWATQIYKLCNDANSLNEAEKSIVTKEIQKLKAKTNDEFIKDLFDMSIERLKK